MKRTLLLAASAALFGTPTIAQELPPRCSIPPECFARVALPDTFQTPKIETTARFTTKFEWQQVLCEHNTGPDAVRAIQTSLRQQSFYTGPVGDRLDQQTYESIERFQKARGLAYGGVTLKTLDALGVDWRAIVARDKEELRAIASDL